MVVVDSGSSDSLDNDAIGAGAKRTVAGGNGLGHSFPIKVGYWRSVSLGPWSLPGATGATGASAIGGQILHRFTVTFDYPHKKLWLQPNRSFHDPFPDPR